MVTLFQFFSLDHTWVKAVLLFIDLVSVMKGLNKAQKELNKVFIEYLVMKWTKEDGGRLPRKFTVKNKNLGFYLFRVSLMILIVAGFEWVLFLADLINS